MPIERIDHIALAQPFDAFDEAGLFYRSVLDLEPRDSAGAGRRPTGCSAAARSRARDGRVRLALNVPALAAPHHRQAELQHVAFACGDALAAAAAMRERGVPLLPIPDNYYDDLAARLELDPRCWTRCASWACSTTAAPAGSSCTSTRRRIGGRVFFEVLERRGAYDGFGAVNSPVRMAAQRIVAAPVP